MANPNSSEGDIRGVEGWEAIVHGARKRTGQKIAGSRRVHDGLRNFGKDLPSQAEIEAEMADVRQKKAQAEQQYPDLDPQAQIQADYYIGDLEGRLIVLERKMTDLKTRSAEHQKDFEWWKNTGDGKTVMDMVEDEARAENERQNQEIETRYRNRVGEAKYYTEKLRVVNELSSFARKLNHTRTAIFNVFNTNFRGQLWKAHVFPYIGELGSSRSACKLHDSVSEITTKITTLESSLETDSKQGFFKKLSSYLDTLRLNSEINQLKTQLAELEPKLKSAENERDEALVDFIMALQSYNPRSGNKTLVPTINFLEDQRNMPEFVGGLRSGIEQTSGVGFDIISKMPLPNNEHPDQWVSDMQKWVDDLKKLSEGIVNFIDYRVDRDDMVIKPSEI